MVGTGRLSYIVILLTGSDVGREAIGFESDGGNAGIDPRRKLLLLLHCPKSVWVESLDFLNVAINWWLFNLQRHADHHANASRPYYHLRPFHEHGPQLPFGYPTAILAALLPPLWFRIMDPRVDMASAPMDAA